jgi:hypothetical protein
MPRHGRFVVVGHPQHILSRGNNRQDQWGQSRLIRESTNKGWVLGSKRFKDMIEEQLSRKLAPLDRGGL